MCAKTAIRRKFNAFFKHVNCAGQVPQFAHAVFERTKNVDFIDARSRCKTSYKYQPNTEITTNSKQNQKFFE